jgi:hypothetical protein
MQLETPIHPKPLAYTVPAKGFLYPKAVYDSQELLTYCQQMAEQGLVATKEALYDQYLADTMVVVLETGTLRPQDPNKPTLTPIQWADSNLRLMEQHPHDWQEQLLKEMGLDPDEDDDN